MKSSFRNAPFHAYRSSSRSSMQISSLLFKIPCISIYITHTHPLDLFKAFSRTRLRFFCSHFTFHSKLKGIQIRLKVFFRARYCSAARNTFYACVAGERLAAGGRADTWIIEYHPRKVSFFNYQTFHVNHTLTQAERYFCAHTKAVI